MINGNLSTDELCSDGKFLLAEAKLPDKLYGSAESLLSQVGSYNLSMEISTFENSLLSNLKKQQEMLCKFIGKMVNYLKF